MKGSEPFSDNGHNDTHRATSKERNLKAFISSVVLVSTIHQTFTFHLNLLPRSIWNPSINLLHRSLACREALKRLTKSQSWLEDIYKNMRYKTFWKREGSLEGFNTIVTVILHEETKRENNWNEMKYIWLISECAEAGAHKPCKCSYVNLRKSQPLAKA